MRFTKSMQSWGYPVIAINPNDAAQYEEDNFENMVKRAKQKKFAFPYLHDETQAVAAMYGATKNPRCCLCCRKRTRILL
jgi:peroxiredoxin